MERPTIISASNVSKTYSGNFQALNNISLEVKEGEILALLGPNGAGKTTLISTICGIVNATSGSISVGGYDIVKDYRITRSLIGLVPQELTLGAFDSVWNTMCFSRGLFGKKPDSQFIEKTLKQLSLWDKKDNELMTLSGGMKRRVLIGKALVHEPKILFLDEPTAGVDVELRKDMWKLVENLRASGVTIILTTHYIEEAEAIADRVGVINKGELLIIDDTASLMHKLGKRELLIELDNNLDTIPETLSGFPIQLDAKNSTLVYTYDPNMDNTGIDRLLQLVQQAELNIKDLKTKQSSLEEIFVSLVKEQS